MVTKKEKILMINALHAATHKVAKKVRDGFLVSDTEFYQLAESAYKGEVFLGRIESIIYEYSDGVGNPFVKITCSWSGLLFECSFYIEKPPGKFKDQSLIVYNISVEEVSEKNI